MWETSNSLWAAVQSGTNMVYHAAGWLEGGLIASPEKFIMDCEVLQLIQRYFEPIITQTGVDDIGVYAIREVGSSGHFFGVQHTQDRYEHAFHQPLLVIGVIMKDGNLRAVSGLPIGRIKNTKKF